MTRLLKTVWLISITFTIQASNGKGRFLASLNILNNNGIVKGDKDTYKRFTGQINADYDVYKWLNISTNTSFEKWKTKGVTKGYGSLLNSVVSVRSINSCLRIAILI